MRYGLLILAAIFGVVAIAVVRTYQLNSSSPASPTPTLPNSVQIVQPSQPQNPEPPFEIRGTISSVKGDMIVVNGRSVSVPKNADVRVKLKPKERVLVQGFIRSDGTYVARQITAQDGEQDSEGGG